MSLFNCSTFTNLGNYNTRVNQNHYVKYSNDSLHIEMLLYGDFVYADSQKDYKLLSASKNRHFKKNIVLYGFTTDPDYHLDITVVRWRIFNKKDSHSKVINCNSKYLKLYISDNAPRNDIDFLLQNFKCDK